MHIARITAAVLLLCLAAAPATRPADSLGDKIVAFCKDHMGEQVDNGECAVLAGQALKAAGARQRTGKDAPESGDYVWGKLVALIEARNTGGAKISNGKLADIRTGDIIQFRDVKFVHHEGNRTGWSEYAHHTAVVSAISEGGTNVHILQQNVSGKKPSSPATYTSPTSPKAGCASTALSRGRGKRTTWRRIRINRATSLGNGAKSGYVWHCGRAD